MEEPENEMPLCLIVWQPITDAMGVGLIVGVSVRVGVRVMVDVCVMVGVSVLVGVLDGVNVNCRVGVLVGVGVFVGVRVVVAVTEDVAVGVFDGVGLAGLGVFVTVMEMLSRTVRALSPTIGSPLATERSIKGTNL